MITERKSSITTQTKRLNGKCLQNHDHGQDLNLDIGEMIKNKPRLCNVFDFIRQRMCKLLKNPS